MRYLETGMPSGSWRLSTGPAIARGQHPLRQHPPRLGTEVIEPPWHDRSKLRKLSNSKVVGLSENRPTDSLMHRAP
jgi:hypothetical protein